MSILIRAANMTRPALLIVILMLATSMALAACTNVAPRVPDKRTEPAPGLLVEAHAPYHLVVPGSGVNVPSRLLLLHVRVEAASRDAVVLGQATFRLTLPNQTLAQIFDPPRARVLLERTRLGPMARPGIESSPDQPPSEQIPKGRKDELLSLLFGAGETDSSAADSNTSREGYLVVDTRHFFASLDGAVLEVSVAQDGAMRLSGAYQFDSPSEVAPLIGLP